ncbi:hypothetical protein ACOMA7_05215 [Apilactobacillus sp. 1-1-2]|uniref:hypothetical protein n=1 Tax=Apilactobacillus sp. 1-1-2 TaxID=3411035 RepID=UPI003B96063A|nr:hypothetical protein [Bifidobacteriales bacterium]
MLDNEFYHKDKKPLRNFLEIIYKTKELTCQYQKLISEGKLEIANNLYLITLIKNKRYKNKLQKYIEDNIGKFKYNNDLSIDIEDLIDYSKITINNKTFSRKVKNDDKEFGKQTLSKYVYKNYETLDLSKFIPLLDQLKEFCK